MNMKNKILDIITNPIESNYLEKDFNIESEFLKNNEKVTHIEGFNQSIDEIKPSVSEKDFNWLKVYEKRITEKKFPDLWSFYQDAIFFNFREELEEFDKKEEYVSLGTNPDGDWFVMTSITNSEVYLCDQYDYEIYDYWKSPNHVLAWALRVVLAEENEITSEEVESHLEKREIKIDEKTISRIIEELN